MLAGSSRSGGEEEEDTKGGRLSEVEASLRAASLVVAAGKDLLSSEAAARGTGAAHLKATAVVNAAVGAFNSGMGAKPSSGIFGGGGGDDDDLSHSDAPPLGMEGYGGGLSSYRPSGIGGSGGNGSSRGVGATGLSWKDQEEKRHKEMVRVVGVIIEFVLSAVKFHLRHSCLLACFFLSSMSHARRSNRCRRRTTRSGHTAAHTKRGKFRAVKCMARPATAGRPRWGRCWAYLLPRRPSRLQVAALPCTTTTTTTTTNILKDAAATAMKATTTTTTTAMSNCSNAALMAQNVANTRDLGHGHHVEEAKHESTAMPHGRSGGHYQRERRKLQMRCLL